MRLVQYCAISTASAPPVPSQPLAPPLPALGHAPPPVKVNLLGAPNTCRPHLKLPESSANNPPVIARGAQRGALLTELPPRQVPLSHLKAPLFDPASLAAQRAYVPARLVPLRAEQIHALNCGFFFEETCDGRSWALFGLRASQFVCPASGAPASGANLQGSTGVAPQACQSRAAAGVLQSSAEGRKLDRVGPYCLTAKAKRLHSRPQVARFLLGSAWPRSQRAGGRRAI
mmetsp:Transcript_25869/g.65217  ORF Transcript_25869/g.65217 Transcript_25869/m.65217 type:complete len:230 (-) Transcript_25869:909-1598(-)